MNPKARSDSIVVQEIGEEVILYDKTTHGVHRLNRAAAIVWRYCNGENDDAQLAQIVRDRLDVPGADKIVGLALGDLHRAGLLEESGVAVDRVTRREAVHKMGRLAGGVAIGLPIVASMLAPTPAMACSCGCPSGPDHDDGDHDHGADDIHIQACTCNAQKPGPPPDGADETREQVTYNDGECRNCLGFRCGNLICTWSRRWKHDAGGWYEVANYPPSC